MTGFDLGLAVLVVVGAAWGMWVGAARQVVQILAWVAALTAPWFLAAPVTRALEKPLGVPFPLALAFCAASVALFAYIAVRLLLWLPLRARRKKDRDEASILGLGNRVAGGLMGAAKAGAVLWACLSLMAVVAAPLQARGYRLGFTDSEMYREAADHNLWGLVFRERLARLQEAVKRAKAKGPKAGSAALEELAKDPRVRELMKDPALKAALAKGDVATLLRSSQVMSLVSDEAALERMAAALAAGAQASTGLAGQ